MTRYEGYTTDARGRQAPLTKEERDVCLVESLNQYIKALEGRIGCLEKTVREQRKTIKELCRVVKLFKNLIPAGQVADEPPTLREAAFRSVRRELRGLQE
jgi:hypothetical protein